MLDFLLVFSLPKLVFDDEMCGQALRFVREIEPLDDLPTTELIDQLMADQHLIMADHTMRHWPERALPAEPDRRSRQPRELDARLARKDTYQRAIDEVERRLAAYHQLETDPAVDAELRRIIRSGLVDQDGAARDPCRARAGGRERPRKRRAAAQPPARAPDQRTAPVTTPT